MKSGVPFHTAFGAPAGFELDDQFRTALIIAIGELNGGTWNWASMRWEERK